MNAPPGNANAALAKRRRDEQSGERKYNRSNVSQVNGEPREGDTYVEDGFKYIYRRNSVTGRNEWFHEKLAENAPENTPREPRIRFYTPCSLRDFVPDNDIVLVGDCHIMRGEVFVIGGEPGVGKSIAATQLAVSGATRRDWFGHTVHRQFRTMVVQTENGRYRLQQEFSALDCDEIENWIRVS
jgi:AAA domain